MPQPYQMTGKPTTADPLWWEKALETGMDIVPSLFPGQMFLRPIMKQIREAANPHEQLGQIDQAPQMAPTNASQQQAPSAVPQNFQASAPPPGGPVSWGGMEEDPLKRFMRSAGLV